MMETLGEGTPQFAKLPTITPPDDGNLQISVSECAHPLASFDAARLRDNQDKSMCMSSDSPSVPSSSSVQQSHCSSLSCEGHEEVDKSLQEEYPESEEKLLHTSAVQGYQTEETLQTRISLQPEINTFMHPESLQRYLQKGNTSSKPTKLTKDSCDQKVIKFGTSGHSFGEKILQAWTDGIMTISTNPNPELREESRAVASTKSSENVEALLPNEPTLVESNVELSQAEDGYDDINISTAPADIEVPPGNLPPLFSRPSRIVFACEEREEHLLQDSDSELEMTPGCELQVSDSHTHICSEEAESTPRRKKENLELPVDDTHSLQPPPPPPPPPPMFQHSLSKRDTVLCPCTDTTFKVEPQTAKCGGGFGLQSFFGSKSIQLVRPLHSMTFGPLGTLKLTQTLELGVQNISANMCTQPQPNELTDKIGNASNKGSHQALDKQFPEPPSKKPRLLANGVIPMGAGSVPCDSLTFTEEYTCGFEMYPLPGLQHLNRHQNFTTAISNTDQLQQNTTPEATVPVMSSSPEAELDTISHYQVEPGKLEYPHQPSDSADDGQDTVYQAVPTECARDHAQIPNMVPCGNESEDRRDDHDDTNGGNELEVPVDQQFLYNNSQTSKHLLDDWKMAVSEVPYLDEQEEQLSSPEMSQVPKVTLTMTEASPAPTYTVLTSIDEQSTESAPSLPTVYHHQFVPDDSLNSSFTIHSLYEQPESVKEQKADLRLCSSLEDVDIDDLDGPTVVAMALESIEARHKTISEESPEQVPQSPLHHWSSAYASCKMSSGGSVPKNLPGSTPEVFQTTRLNLTRPKLRLGLSRRQKCKPLHTTH